MRVIQDLIAFSSSDSRKIVKMIITVLINPNFHCVCLYRLSHFLYRLHMSPLSKVIWYINRLLFHVDIDYRADLAGGFVLVHGLGTVIGKNVISKGSLTVYQNVTLGGGNGKPPRLDEDGVYRGMPLIMPNCTICAGAICVGGIVISENSFIKAGSIIAKDI